jgi:hypothetical protein
VTMACSSLLNVSSQLQSIMSTFACGSYSRPLLEPVLDRTHAVCYRKNDPATGMRKAVIHTYSPAKIDIKSCIPIVFATVTTMAGQF